MMPDDTAETLAARVLEAEHKLYPLALRLVASGQAQIENSNLRLNAQVDLPPTLVMPCLKSDA